MRRKAQSGVALVTTLLILVLMSALLAGFTILVMSDQRMNAIDRDRRQAFYAAEAGMEKMTADIGTLFSANIAPTAAQINALAGQPPILPGVQYVSPAGGPGYIINFPVDGFGNPAAQTQTILSGPFEGFVGLITPYSLTVTARTTGGATGGSEVRLFRTIQTVGIPVFQFGIFSEVDLSFFPGPLFNFGGRVHTNRHLFLASGSQLFLGDRVTVVGEIVRQRLANGVATSVNHTGRVSAITSPGNFRDLLVNEGSVVDSIGSAVNEPMWTNLSLSTYNANIRNGRTGARILNLPLTTLGAAPIDLIRRPQPNEDVNNPGVFAQRFFTHNPGDQITSLRILLSDTAADITGLPTVTANAPVQLVGIPAGYIGGIPFAASPGVAAPAVCTPAQNATANGRSYWTCGRPLIGGFLKIEMMGPAGWQDVTLEILNLGIAARNLAGLCAHPSPNAVLRFQRVRETPAPAGGACGTAPVQVTTDQYWPLVLYDTREGNLRDNIAAAQTRVFLGGVMHYLELDMNNLARWFTGAIGVNGANAVRSNGMVVYFSDRRGSRVDDTPGLPPASRVITGELGFEDFVNPASAAAAPNGNMDTGEDVNEDGFFQTYGNRPIMVASAAIPPFPATGTYPPPGSPCAAGYTCLTPAPANSTNGSDAALRNKRMNDANQNNMFITTQEAKVNAPLFFRRALKIVNASTINLGACGATPCGITIASENPVYIENHFNAPGGSFAGASVPAAVIADAITFLSQNWNDRNSLGATPHSLASRVAATTFYRLAIVSGKGLNFPHPAGTPTDFGTDGGVHNFLRYLESWGGRTLNYRGSIVSFYYARQAVGTYKCCTNVYSPPTRGYNFDINFLTPSLLPPRTPTFRDVNATGFSQDLFPTP